MDPDRVKAYLQVACAGLGFDIGEVWWTSNETGHPSLPEIENKEGNGAIVTSGPGDRHLKFVQLYTSKSYEDRKSMLLSPDSEGREDETTEAGIFKNDSDVKKHVLSPQLVNAISNTSQVLWANSQTHEGLLGRSDLPLLTAVGMPVAIDGNGNMCVVVMFSPENLQNTDEAMEYLQFISRSATSSSIPCLLPVFDAGSNMRAPALLPPSTTHTKHFTSLSQDDMSPSLGKGVTARFVSLEEGTQAQKYDDFPRNDDDLTEIDCFGIPTLPTYAEIGNDTESPTESSPMDGDAFDDVSFGVWSTIMNTPLDDAPRTPNAIATQRPLSMLQSVSSSSHCSESSSVVTAGKPFLPSSQKERLEEFSSAFLGMSVFDAADAWIPHGGTSADELCHVTSVVSTSTNEALSRFAVVSQNVLIKPWSGAVGRAFASGTPVWSAKRDVIVDSERSGIFDNAAIRTALAIPIFSDQSEVPVCVVCYYSILRTDPVPVVLRFLQQALRLLWDGLEKIEPHQSVGKEMWRDVAPADLGEMAADLEMQQEFLRKKRPREVMAPPEKSKCEKHRERSSSLSLQLQSLNLPNQSAPIQSQGGYTDDASRNKISDSNVDSISETINASNHQMGPSLSSFQSHQKDFTQVATSTSTEWNIHQHIPTNIEGSKRAHIVSADTLVPPQVVSQSPPPQPFSMPGQTHMMTPQFQQPTTVQGSQSPIPRDEYRQGDVHVPFQAMQQHNIPYQDHQQHVSYQFQQHSVPYIDQQPQGSFPTQQETLSYTDQRQTLSPSIYLPHSHSLSQPQLIPLQMPNPLPSQFVSSPRLPSAEGSIAMAYVNHIPEQQNSVQYQNMLQHTQMTVPNAPRAPPPFQFSSIPTIVPHQIQSNTDVMSQQNTNGQSLNGNTAIQGSMIYLQASSLTPMTTSENSQFFMKPGMTMGVIHIPSEEGDKPCRIDGCSDLAVARRPYCAKHSGNRLCENADCDKCAQGSTRFCIAHGGGRRCTHPGCDKGARDRYFCAAHGGGKRCQHPTCMKSAVGGSSLCTSHGGGRRCAVEGCDKSAQSSTRFCVKHGGGKKCAQDRCEKVARGRTNYCAAHGGGVRCKLEGCNRVAIGKLQLCRAHGGGSTRSRSRSDPSTPLDIAPFMATIPIQQNSGNHNI